MFKYYSEILDFLGPSWPLDGHMVTKTIDITQSRDGLCQRLDYPEHITVWVYLKIIQRKKITNWTIMSLDGHMVTKTIFIVST